MNEPTISNVVPLPTFPCREAALDYAARGFFIAPLHTIREGFCTCLNGKLCHSPAKHPRLAKRYKPSSEQRQVAKWWKSAPDSNIGIFPGMSGLVVLDIDPRNGGNEGLRELEEQHGELPHTWRSVTGGGGEHYYFSRPEASPVLRSCVLGQGVEVKAHSGYVVAPPSMHFSGRQYHWDAGAHPSETEIALLPAWIRVLIEGEQNAFAQMQVGRVIDGLLGAAFMAAGMAGQELGPDKIAVICPWEDEHTSGRQLDGSTVVFAPLIGKKTGWFHCSHAHCQNLDGCRRSAADVIAALPVEAVDAAKARLGIDPAAPCIPQGRVDVPERPEPTKKLDAAIDRSWEASLRWNGNGTILCPDAGNAALILANDPTWKGRLTYDAMADHIFWAEAPPPLPGLCSPKDGGTLLDEDVTYVQHWLARVRGVKFSAMAVRDAIILAAKTNSFDSLRHYLETLQWDGMPRIDTWLSAYLGATSTPFATWAGAKWLVSAVARALEPGCQVDHMLILEGNQGLGKSTAMRILAGKWHLEGLPDLGNKDALVVLAGTWIAEIGELDAIRGVQASKVKEFLTRVQDVYRPPYGRTTITRRRRFVFCGTTNEARYLVDSTGGRRFWPVRCGLLHREHLIRDRDQLWAEAVVRYQAKEMWYPNREQQKMALEEQSARRDLDIWEAKLLPLITAARHADGTRMSLRMTEVAACLGFGEDNISKLNPRDQHRIARIMRIHGYHRKRVRTDTSRAYLWVYDPDAADIELGFSDVEPSKRDPSRQVPDPRDPHRQAMAWEDEI